MADTAPRDQNFIPVIQGVDSVTFSEPTNIAVNPTTHAVITEMSEGMKIPEYDYVSVAYPQDDTEVYTFKVGGSSGTEVAEITIVYTNDTKEFISTVTKTLP